MAYGTKSTPDSAFSLIVSGDTPEASCGAPGDDSDAFFIISADMLSKMTSAPALAASSTCLRIALDLYLGKGRGQCAGLGTAFVIDPCTAIWLSLIITPSCRSAMRPTAADAGRIFGQHAKTRNGFPVSISCTFVCLIARRIREPASLSRT